MFLMTTLNVFGVFFGFVFLKRFFQLLSPQLRLFSCVVDRAGGRSSDPVEDLGLFAVSRAKCLLWLEQWSIVCFWMSSLCLNLALEHRSAQGLLQPCALDPKVQATCFVNTTHNPFVSHCIGRKKKVWWGWLVRRPQSLLSLHWC